MTEQFIGMSTTMEEDTELRDLLIEKLKTNGTLDKIRAQLRASVFLALEEHQSEKPKKPVKPLVNEKAAKFVSSTEGELCAKIIKEFLDYFDLKPTLSVFEPDCGLEKDKVSRVDLGKQIGVDSTSDVPLLALLIRKAQEGPTHSHRGDHRSKDSLGLFEKPKSSVPSSVPPLVLGLRDDKPSKVALAKSSDKTDLIVDDEDEDFFQKPPVPTSNNLLSQLKDSIVDKPSSNGSKVTDSRSKDQISTGPSKTSLNSSGSSILGDLPHLGVKKSLPPLGFGSPQQPPIAIKTDSGAKVKVPLDLFGGEMSDDEKTPDISDSTDRSDKSASKKGGSGNALDLILSGGKAKSADNKLPPMNQFPKPTKVNLPEKPEELSRGVSTEDDISEEIPEDIEGETNSQKSAANSF